MYIVRDLQGSTYELNNINNENELLLRIQERFDVRSFELFHNNEKFKWVENNDQTLLLNLLPTFRGGMQVQVKVPSGKTLQMDCDLDAKFGALKKKISERNPSICYDHLIVLFQNKPIQEDQTLKEVGVNAEAQLEALSVQNLIDRYENTIKKLRGDPDILKQSGVFGDQAQQKSFSDIVVELSRKDLQIQSLNNKLKDLEGDQQDKLQSDRLQKRLKQYEQDAQENQNKINLQSTQLTKLIGEKNDALSQIEMLQLQKDNEIQFYDQQNSLNQQAMDRDHEENMGLKQNLIDKLNEIENLEYKIQELEFEDKHQKEDIQTLKSQLKAAKDQKVPEDSYVDQKQNSEQFNILKSTIQDNNNQQEIGKAQIQELNKIINTLQVQCKQLREQNTLHLSEISKLNNQINNDNKQFIQRANELTVQLQVNKQNIEIVNQEKSRQEKQILSINNMFDELKLEKSRISLKLDQSQQELEDIKSEKTGLQEKKNQLIQKLSQEEREKEKICEQNDGDIMNLEKQIKNLKNQIQQVETNLEEFNFENQALKNDVSILQSTIQKFKTDKENCAKAYSDMEANMQNQLIALKVKKDALVSSLAQKKPIALRTKMLEGILGPMEVLFKSSTNIPNFLNDPNVLTDTSVLQLSFIKINEEIFDKKLNGLSDLNFDEGYTLQPHNAITCVRSVNAIADGDLQQVFLIQVRDDSSNTFTNKILSIKHLKDTPNFTDSKTACKSVTGHLIAKFLMQKYVISLNRCMKEKIPKLKYQDLYLLDGGPGSIPSIQEIVQNRMFICEEVAEGTFRKYNGAGKFKETGHLAEFCNGFSYFSYHYSQRQVLVSYVQGVDENLYDPVVSTEDGILDENDYGYDEISSFLHGMKEGDPKLMGRKYLGALNIKVT